MTPLELSGVVLQVVGSPMIVILATLEVSFMLLENIYSTRITHDDCHCQNFIVQATELARITFNFG